MSTDFEQQCSILEKHDRSSNSNSRGKRVSTLIPLLHSSLTGKCECLCSPSEISTGKPSEVEFPTQKLVRTAPTTTLQSNMAAQSINSSESCMNKLFLAHLSYLCLIKSAIHSTVHLLPGLLQCLHVQITTCCYQLVLLTMTNLAKVALPLFQLVTGTRST